MSLDNLSRSLLQEIYSNPKLNKAFNEYKFDEIYKYFIKSDFLNEIKMAYFTNSLLGLGINPLDYVDNVYVGMFRATMIEECVILGKFGRVPSDMFEACRTLKSVYITEGIDEIGSHAFSICDSLVKVNLPSSLRKIGAEAFWDNDNLKIIDYAGTKQDWAKIIITKPNFGGERISKKITQIKCSDGIINIKK